MENNIIIPEPSDKDREDFKVELRKLYPTAEGFENFATPYLKYFVIRSDYEKYLVILKNTLDVNGLKGLSQKLSAMGDIAVESATEMINGVINIFNKKYGNGQPLPESMAELIRECMNELSFDKLVPIQTELNEAMYKEYSEGFEKMDEKAEALNEEERDIYDYFSALILRLWIKMILTNPNYSPAMGIFLKSYLLRYYQSMEHLYAKTVSPELIKYIEDIEIPNEAELRSEINRELAEKNSLPVKAIPQFQHVEEIHAVLHKYFDNTRHAALRNAMQGQSQEMKLFFKGHQNQLADAFKQLLKTALITGCNKEELIQWISETFEYKSERSGKNVPCSVDYLRDIISTDQKPCKKPIIHIEKDREGNVKIFSPDRQDRNNPKI